jgi:hypothetical protein
VFRHLLLSIWLLLVAVVVGLDRAALAAVVAVEREVLERRQD